MFCAGPKNCTCKNLKCLETVCLAFSAHHKAGNASIMKIHTYGPCSYWTTKVKLPINSYCN